MNTRWVQLSLMIACTVMLSNMQYGWTLFVNPMHNETHWPKAGIQLAFTIMVLVNTWLAPVQGMLVDRYGPRPVVLSGGIFGALSWFLDGRASSLPTLYVAAVIGGLAVGCVFGTCMGTALKWFPDRRGLATGLIAAGFGLGAAFTASPLTAMIRNSGYRHAFLIFGLIQGGTVVVLSLLLCKPVVPAAWAAARTVRQRAGDFTPAQTIRKPVFWMIYVVYVMVAFGGMVITAQLGPIAGDFAIALPVLTIAISIDNFANGITRPLSGFISDKIGRENAMLLIFGCEGLAFLGMIAFGHNPTGFVIFAALIFLFWGEVFCIFPAICGDTFGVSHAAANNGLMYTAKGTSALAVPVASLLFSATGSWNTVLLASAICSIAAGILAKFVVAPMRKRLLA